MVDVTEILQHWYAGRPKVEVARSLGVDAKTVRRYVAPAEAAGMAPGGPPVSEEQWRALARDWFPQLAGTGIRQVSWRQIAVHHGPPRESWRLQSLERMESCQRPRDIPVSYASAR